MINNADLTGEVDAERQEHHPEGADDSSDEKEKPAKSTDIGAMIG